MKYNQLKVGDKTYEKEKEIHRNLEKQNLHWILDAEFENADIEIRNNTLIWNSGNWLHGTWKYGIWMTGVFHGIWENGIFEGGSMKGDWKSGIDFTGKITQK